MPVVARLDDTAGGASWPTDPGPGSEGGSLVPPGAGPGPRTCSTRFRSGAYSANRGKQGRSWPGPTSLGPLARTRTPGPVLARPNTPLGRVVSRVAARSGTCARPPRAGQLRYVHPCAQSGTCARSPPRLLRPAPPRRLVRDLPRGEEGRVCAAPAVAGGRFRRNLRIRTRAPSAASGSRPLTCVDIGCTKCRAGWGGSDPQIATRARNRASRQVADHPEECIEPPESTPRATRDPHPRKPIALHSRHSGAGCSLTHGRGG